MRISGTEPPQDCLLALHVNLLELFVHARLIFRDREWKSSIQIGG